MTLKFSREKKCMPDEDVGHRLHFVQVSNQSSIRDENTNADTVQEWWWPCIQLDDISQMVAVLNRRDLFSEKDAMETKLEIFENITNYAKTGDAPMCLLLGNSPPNRRRLIYKFASIDHESITDCSLLPFDLTWISKVLSLHSKDASFWNAFTIASNFEVSRLRASLEEDKEVSHDTKMVLDKETANNSRQSNANCTELKFSIAEKQKNDATGFEPSRAKLDTKVVDKASIESPTQNEVSQSILQQTEQTVEANADSYSAEENVVPATIEKVARRLSWPESEHVKNEQRPKHWETPIVALVATHGDDNESNLTSKKRMTNSGNGNDISLISSDISPMKRRKVVDSTSALVSLQSDSPCSLSRQVSENDTNVQHSTNPTGEDRFSLKNHSFASVSSKQSFFAEKAGNVRMPNVETATEKRKMQKASNNFPSKSIQIEMSDKKQSHTISIPVIVPGLNDVWKFLSKIGFKKYQSQYWLPGRDLTCKRQYIIGEDYFASESDLRAFLCAYGIEAHIDSLSAEQLSVVEQWVRCTVLKSVDFSIGGKRQANAICTPREAQEYLKRIGFVYDRQINGMALPGVDSSTANDGVDIFCKDKDLYLYLARFGIPANSNTDQLSSEELLSLELYIALDVQMDIL
jgi:hypothetical protein